MKEQIKKEITRIINIHFSDDGTGLIYDSNKNLHDNFIDPIRLGARLAAFFQVETGSIRLDSSSTFEEITEEVMKNLPQDYQI